ncbi:hypothetical protein VB776_00995 [Arcicella sp. DC2W]|uniref:Right handed beta helix domain-containing protein n=1 Tax=Arcicella gelida TaxID=2984195 RepID=A0ABU5RZ31_9BACT|nr:hypothetical protein [Arcicella sp. DC2W]MEA5401470.1 hypothetical protein [Arcicella sp. DC2W]
MKKCVLIFALLFINFAVLSQTIRRVNNTSGLNDPAIYATAQAAHDAAKDGDIIQLEPSDNPNYGDLTVTKKLTILGIGYDLDNIANPFFDKRVPKLSGVSFDFGSAKSTIMGVDVGVISVNDESINISRCKTGAVYLGFSQNSNDGSIYSYGNKAIIVQCLVGQIGSLYGYFNKDLGNNCTISNNIIQGGLSNLFNSVISNNTFKSSSTIFYYSIGCVFSNNIIDARDGSEDFKVVNSDVTGSTISNNLCTTFTGLPTGGGNVNKANATIIFKVANPWYSPETGLPLIDSNLQLADKSPAKTVGAGSTAIGAYAGSRPYIPSGIPNTPVITTFISSGFGTTTTPLNIMTSVRSSN